MFMRKTSTGFVYLLASSSVTAVLLISSAIAQEGPFPAPPWSTAGEETPKLGRAASAAEIAPYDIDAEPDGSGLPAGRGTAKQGAAVYAEKCQACHGEKGVKGPATQLVGGIGTIGKGDEVKPIKTVGSYWPYATSVFAYIRRAMPYFDTKSLSPDELYAVTAYILQLNGLIGEKDTMDKNTLPKVQMPNKDGFFQWSRGTP
jgi:cytochrome c